MCTNGRRDVHEWKRFSDRFVEICTSKRKKDHSCLDAKIQKEKHQKGGNSWLLQNVFEEKKWEKNPRNTEEKRTEMVNRGCCIGSLSFIAFDGSLAIDQNNTGDVRERNSMVLPAITPFSPSITLLFSGALCNASAQLGGGQSRGNHGAAAVGPDKRC